MRPPHAFVIGAVAVIAAFASSGRWAKAAARQRHRGDEAPSDRRLLLPDDADARAPSIRGSDRPLDDEAHATVDLDQAKGFRAVECVGLCQQGSAELLRPGPIEPERQEEARLRAACRMFGVEEVVDQLAVRNLEDRPPAFVDQGTERPVRTSCAASTVASAPGGSGNSTS